MNDRRFGWSSLPTVPLTFAIIGVVGACSTEHSPSSADALAEAGVPADAGAVDQDAAPADFGSDAGCDDCEWFPTDCSPTMLCNAGVELDGFTTLNGVTVTDTDVWAVGSQGIVVHHDGTTWSTQHLAEPDTMMQIIQRPEGGLWAIGGPLYAGPNAEDAGASGFARTTMPVMGLIQGLWAPTDGATAWAVGENIFKIQVDETGTPSINPYFYSGDLFGISAIHGTEDGFLWAVGRIGSVYRIWDLDANVPQADTFNTQTFATLNAVWAIGSNDVWAVGDQGIVRHYTGHGRVWDIVESPVTTGLRALWAGSSTDVWAVGDGGVALHYDGTRWQRVPVSGLGTRHPDLRAIWGTSSGRVYAVGGNVVLGLGASVTGGAK